MRPGKASERLRRLLTLAPYIVQNPGERLEDLARLFGVSESTLVADLNLLFVSGLPPYGPGDLIDVQIEDGRVSIEMADYFARPLRLSRTEALALYLRATALLGAPGLSEAPAVRSALAKLERHLGGETLGDLSGRVEIAEGGRPAEMLELVRAAADGHARVEIEYYAASRDETSVRLIEPEVVFSAIGNWYVVAWDEQAGDERMFRADRIKSLRETGETFEPRGLAGVGRPLYTRSPEDFHVRLRLRPAGRWVAEYYDTESVTETGGGDVEVVIPAKHLAWVATLVVRLGGASRVIEPPELEREVHDVAERTLALYR